ncbi:hypothetical protein [Ruminiclostridium cellobioparum]|uniref:hypothetical protein n=1 Tax=Ruminiclostridium cellobioparum TaxID=29355 RepID=UPI000349109D|nr:hypothetical protein [Ruminiclostridium cellobioparum]
MPEIAGEAQVFLLANRQEADLSSNPRQEVEYCATAKTPVMSRANFSMYFGSNPFIEVCMGALYNTFHIYFNCSGFAILYCS